MGLFGFWKKKAKDPVCGMEVDPRTAAASAQHGGKTYHFCSAACHRKFTAKPQQYAT